MSSRPIATCTLYGREPGKDRVQIVVEIGAPYQVGTEEWACAVSVRGLFADPAHIHGSDSLQALSLANRYAFNLLSYFKEDGGVLEHETGEEFPLVDVFGMSPSVPKKS